jgi:hypothetical protein
LAQQAGNYKRAANSFSPFRRARQALGGYENLALQKRKLTVFRNTFANFKFVFSNRQIWWFFSSLHPHI